MADESEGASATNDHDDQTMAEEGTSLPSKRLKVSDPSESTESQSSHHPEDAKDSETAAMHAFKPSLESNAEDSDEKALNGRDHFNVFDRLSKIQTFECQTAGCSGKLTIDEDICKVGHGVIVVCKGGTSKTGHRYKWCNYRYSFVPASEWSSHVSWCDGGHAQGKHALGKSKVDELLESTSNKPPEPFSLQDVKETKDDRPSKRGAGEQDGGGRGGESKVDTIKNLQEEMLKICEKEQKYIFCGDTESMQGWVEHVKDVQNRSLLCDMRQNVSTSSETSQVTNETVELFAAVARGEMEKLSRMLAQGIAVNIQDGKNNFPLHWAASAGSTAICRILLDQGADCNAASGKGDTPLHIAAAHGRMGVVQLLVARGGDLDKQNHDGITARQLLNVLTEANCA
uniref:Uncharacterized protein n=1 Tax=Hanusia phi TaxID=3032 RepID=A0A6T7LV78_9CRYP